MRIVFDDLSLSYSHKVLISEFSRQIDVPDDRGRFIMVLGRSGTGKSTLLRMMAGLTLPTRGSFRIDPNGIISYLPQDLAIFPGSARWNVELLGKLGYMKPYYNKNKVEHLLGRLSISKIDQWSDCTVLSGGERQRLALARACSINPRILLLDEPCVALDKQIKFQFLCELQELALQYGLVVFYVTHDFEDALVVADDVLFLSQNYKKEPWFGELKTFLNSPPNLEAIEVGSRSPVSCLKCTLERDAIQIENSDLVIPAHEVVQLGSDKVGKVANLAFRADDVSFCCGSTSRSTEMPGRQRWPSIKIGEAKCMVRSIDSTTGLPHLLGHGYLLDSNFALISSFQLKPFLKGE